MIQGMDMEIDPESRIDEMMIAYQGAVPGAGLAVLREGVPIVCRAYGLSDVEHCAAATPATNYRLASMTKQFTAAAILLLAEDGRLSIDDPVRRWLPTLPDAAAGMLIRHLLTHRSGVLDYEDLIPEGTSIQVHDAGALALLETQNRGYFAPGTSYRYSNSGYVLLSLIVGRASGMDFASFLRERIFQPLGMCNTMAFVAGVSQLSHRAFGYSLTEDSWVRTDQSLTSATLGDGGIYSSIDDLAKWDAALTDERLLRSASLRVAFGAATPTDHPAVQYGFGWRVSGETLWHTGETVGFQNVILRYVAHRLTVILLTNRNDPAPYPTALAIAGLFLSTAAQAPAVHLSAGPDPRLRPLPQESQAGVTSAGKGSHGRR
jgi:CubicO group peptidase (beta-lactamase class C family)